MRNDNEASGITTVIVGVVCLLSTYLWSTELGTVLGYYQYDHPHASTVDGCLHYWPMTALIVLFMVIGAVMIGIGLKGVCHVRSE